MNKTLFFLLFGIVLVILTSQASIAANNQSIAANSNVTVARECVSDMVLRNISITRANESFAQALQLYTAQSALEAKSSKGADYSLVVQYSEETCSVRDIAIQASDELTIFLEAYSQVSARLNTSEMESTHLEILKSYEEERFEDTIELIDIGYDELSKVESTQTRLALFYKNTGKNFASFFVNYWKHLTVVLVLIMIVVAFAWKPVRKTLLKKKVEHLKMRKNSLIELMRKTQSEYFKTKKMSEMEFSIKMKTFQELMRDIERQFPIFHEQLAKLEGAKKVYK